MDALIVRSIAGSAWACNKRDMLRAILFITALSLAVSGKTSAAAFPSPDREGDSYEITITRDMSEKSGDESSGSSHDKDMIVERVIGLRDGGLELEYDLPASASAQDRASAWQFPARIFKPHRGPSQLLNAPELEARVDAWLKTAGWTREICGRWIFTWNAFRIECDPQSVVATAAAYDLRLADLRAGASYTDEDALGSAVLEEKSAGPDGKSFFAKLDVDPDRVRRGSAETDVVVGEILQKPVTLDEALAKHARDDVTGTISITLDTDADGTVRRRRKVAELELKPADERAVSRTVTTTVERRLISASSKTP